MVRGIERLRKADAALGADGGGPQALVDAAHEVWAAMAALPEWPTDLRMRAVELQGGLFRDGSIRMTVGQMSEPERRGLRRERVSFCEFAARLDVEAGTAEGASAVVADAAEKPPAPASTLGAWTHGVIVPAARRGWVWRSCPAAAGGGSARRSRRGRS